MSEWRYVRLTELAADEKSSISKPFGSAMMKEDYRDRGVPVVRGVNLARGVFHDDDFVFIEPDHARRIPGAIMRAGDLVVTHRGTVGQVSMIPRLPKYDAYVASTSHVKVRLDTQKAVPEFYYYWFSSALGQRTLLENTSTVGVPGLAQPVATMKRLIVPQPPLAVQSAIAELLGSLDDKIAANARLSRSADELTVALFEQTVRGGDLRYESLGSLATVVLGGTPSRTNEGYWRDGTVPWLNSGKANEARVIAPSELITAEALAHSATKMMPAGATILAITGATLGQVARLEIEACGNQSLVGVWGASTALTDWLHFAIRREMPELLRSATGAAQQHVNKMAVAALPVPIAEDSAVRRFGSMARPLLGRAASADRESSVLAKTRDSLLPQLMSGKIRVRDAERVVEGVV